MNQAFRGGTGLSVQDERAISAVVIAYATAIDQRDWQLFYSCFTSDCEADYGAFGTFQSAIALTEFMKQSHAPLGATLHRISNISIRGSESSVHVRSYVDAILATINGNGQMHRGIGSYDDQFVRTADGWKIAKRRFNAVLLE